MCAQDYNIIERLHSDVQFNNTATNRLISNRLASSIIIIFGFFFLSSNRQYKFKKSSRVNAIIILAIGIYTRDLYFHTFRVTVKIGVIRILNR